MLLRNIIILLLAGVLPVRAGISLDDAVREMLARNPGLHAAYLEVEKARARLLQAGLWPNPELEINASTDRAFLNQRQDTGSAAFVQAFPISGRLRHARNLGRVDVARALAEIRDRERILIGQTVQAFIRAQAGAAQVAARRETLERINEYGALTDQRFQAAQGSEVDVSLAKLEAQRLQQEIHHLETEHETAVLELKNLLGLKPGAAISLDGDLRAIAAAFRTTSDGAVLRRPDLEQVRLAAERAEWEARLSRAQAWADVRAGIEYQVERTVDEPEGLGTDHFIGIRLSIPLPLWNRNQGRIREQELVAEQAGNEEDALTHSIAAEVARAQNRAIRLRHILDHYEEQTLPLAAQSSDALRKGYREGLTNFTQVFQAQSQQAALRAAYLETLQDHAQALAELQTAAASSPHLKIDFVVTKTEHSYK